ncbi:MAG: SEC-C domain-containing protein [Lachnospiraceae bacterium]|nr:SEC-C domain-containing protein [Lachnospiraceae bacterium]
MMAEEKKNSLQEGQQDKNQEAELKQAGSDMPRERMTVERILMSEDQSDLLDMAEGLNLRVSGKGKERLASAIARYLLHPDHMRQELLSLSEEELDAVEKLIGNPHSVPDEWESQGLDEFWSLGYATKNSDGTYEVAGDAEAVYNKIRKDGYREYHKKISWMADCLLAFVDLYMAAPVEVVYKMYQREETLDVSYQEFLRIFKKVPDEMNPCCITNGIVASRELGGDELYEALDEVQLDVEYYILTKEEIICRAKDGYMSSSKEYQALEEFITEKMGDNVDWYSLCLTVNNIFMTGGSVSDVLKTLKNRKIKLPVGKDAETFKNILTDAGNNTRMVMFRGHTSREIHETLTPDQLEELRKPTARVNRKTVRRAEGEKKIYPNDPCPCGSGKKYKKCCGKN